MTGTNADTRALVGELVALLRLTRTEAQIARIRVSQARDEAVRQELLDNASEADARAFRIQEQIRRLNGMADVVGDAVGRVIALSKATAEQLQPFSEGLFGDLALEHQLRDRVVFTRVLAEAQDERAVVALMTDLEAAHTETIEWIQVRLAELAQGGPVAIMPTPPQAAFSTLARFAVLPARQYAKLVNRAVDLLRRGRSKAEQVAEETVDLAQDTAAATADRVRETVAATEEIAEAGRNAALARAEEVAPSATVRDAAHEAREQLGTVDPKDLPISDFEELTSANAVKAVQELEDADELRLVVRFEEAHRNRKAVLNAAQKQLTRLAEESVNA